MNEICEKRWFLRRLDTFCGNRLRQTSALHRMYSPDFLAILLAESREGTQRDLQSEVDEEAFLRTLDCVNSVNEVFPTLPVHIFRHIMETRLRFF